MTDCHTCKNSGLIRTLSGGSGWGSGGPEAIVEEAECPDCEVCERCDGTGDCGNWYGDPDVPGGTRGLPCEDCEGTGRRSVTVSGEHHG